ncbi:MAG: hypothetical protein EON54_24210 [Alcaligenaceae bacterium]|nr:MAG: hypothetical protein EON54_24210 [Alcaligenaceae bacterium]
MSDHIASLAHSLSNGNQLFACSGRLIETSGGKNPRRRLDGLVFDRFGDLLEVSHERDTGRFLYKSELIEMIPIETLSLLDGQEHQLLNVWAQINGFPAQSKYASYVHLENAASMLPIPYVQPSLQTELIKDTVRGNSDWLRIRCSVPAKTAVIVRDLTSDHLYSLAAGGDGIKFLSSGFSVPETHSTWIDGIEGTLIAEPRTENTEAYIQILLAARFTPATPNVHCSVFANGTMIGVVSLTEQIRSFVLPAPPLKKATTVRISLKVSAAEQVVAENGKLLDARYLGVRIAGFGILTSPSDSKLSQQLAPPHQAPRRLRRIARAIARRMGMH